MMAASLAEERPTIRVRRAVSYPGLMGLDLTRPPILNRFPLQVAIAAPAKRCLSCGAITNSFGELPCGH